MRWLLLLLLSFNLQAQNTYTIVVDQTLGQPVYPFDEGPSGMWNYFDEFETEIPQEYQYDIVLVGENLDSAISNPTNKLLILTPTINRSYAPATIKAIQKFVLEGGKLLVFAEHDNYYNNSAELNKITEEFGIKIRPDAYKKGEGLTNAWVKANCPQFKIRNVTFYLPATFKLTKNAKALATADTAIVAATAVYGKGKVAVIADYEIAWNFNRDYNGGWLILNATEWLWGHIINPEAQGKTGSLSMTYDTVTYASLEYTGRFHLAYALMGPMRLDLPKDIRVHLFNPREGLTYVNDTTKLVFIYDGSSNYMQMLANSNGQFVLDALQYKERETPTNIAALAYGFRFAQQTLVDSCINSYQITLQPTGQKAWCTSYIDTLQSSNFTVVYTANAAVVDYNAPLGGDDFTPNICWAIPPAAKKEKHIVCLYNKRAFAIADMELFINMKNNPYLLKAFNDWLKLK